MLIKFRWTYSCISINVLVLINVNRLLDINLWAHYHSQGLNKATDCISYKCPPEGGSGTGWELILPGFQFGFRVNGTVVTDV